MRLQKIFHWIVLLAYGMLLLLYILTLLIPYLGSYWWLPSLMAYGFLFLALGLFVFILYWFLVKKIKWALLGLVVLLLGWKSLFSLYALGGNDKPLAKTDKSSIRVLTWNVMRMVGIEGTQEEKNMTKKRALELILAQKPDVICMQEFVNGAPHTAFSILPYMADSAGFPYVVFARDFEWFDGTIHQGQVIFSRYPILDSGRVKFPKPSSPQSLIYADIQKGKDTFRVYTAHLESFRFSAADYQDINDIKSGSVQKAGLFKKISRATYNRGIQARLVRDEMKKSPFPVVFAGDLNDVPGSDTYFTIRQDRTDAFLSKGQGFGRTFTRLSPTLRIDHIFADPVFKVKSVYRLKQRLSDHYGLVADLELTK